MKKAILCFVFILLVIAYVFMNFNFYERKDYIEKQIFKTRHRLFNVFLELKNISPENSKKKHFMKVLKSQNFSTFSLDSNYLCFFKEEKEDVSSNRYCILIFVEKNNFDNFYSFLINYKYPQISYFDSDGNFYILKKFDDNLLKSKTKANSGNIIKYIVDLLSNQITLKNISKKQLIGDFN